MASEKILSVLDIAQELNTGKATVKFLLKRFKKWMPSDVIDGQPFYPVETVKKLFMVQEKLDMGILPGDIEKMLDTVDADSDNIFNHLVAPSQNDDIRLSNNGLALLKSLFHDIGDQQKRIALAHEKRAVAEERKAVAIEKRAEAEEKKAEAMNNIANALQEMNKLRASDPVAHQIAHQAATIITADETDNSPIPLEPDELSNSIEDPDTLNEMDSDLSSLLEDDTLLEDFSEVDDLSDMLDKELEETIDLDDPLNDLNEGLQTDDLSLLVQEKEEDESIEDFEKDLDDLSQLLDDTQAADDTIDDLAKLIDEDLSAAAEAEQLDDLSLLLDTVPATDKNQDDGDLTNPPILMDDLSALIDQNDTGSETKPSIELDDLSKLIDASAESEPPTQELDNLSLLIEKEPISKEEVTPSLQMDDLSKLIDDPKTIKESSQDNNDPEDTQKIRIDISPEQDLGKYKAAVMKIILEFKTQGLGVEETTSRLNENKIRTLSGKAQWGQKAISQIYKFIDSAK
ncbi:MAG: hypothetical protein KKE44_17895 [Proteobacteria bacterium]|nr:hypothetical protein [Pseudomonadota bacterium]MBU1584606.1 hypothetical protein [Pseudomonadota bacterium]MBU2453022.1 hypothetical protein [Pseudomonadota bacterium]MBU2630349.1 hypothetical protein [Pseudomonadota bacterium]